MAQAQAFQPFSMDEIENLRNELSEIKLDLDRNPENWEEFIDSPISYLSTFNIKLLQRFRANPKAAAHFNETVRNILRKLKRMFNKCLGCKMGIIIMIYSLLGSTAHAMDITIGLFTTLLDGIQMYFSGTSKDSDNLLNRLSSLIGKLTIAELALNICRYYKHCPINTETERQSVL